MQVKMMDSEENEDYRWNSMDIEPPLYLPCKICRSDLPKAAGGMLLNSRRLVKEAFEIMSTEAGQYLYFESALVERFVYRMKNMFRRHKGFQYMRKLKKNLNRYLILGLPSIYENVLSLFSEDTTLQRESAISIPSLQSVQYLLFRTITFAKLSVQVVEFIEVAGEHFLECMRYGHFWTLWLLLFAIVSRVWVIAKALTKWACSWYNNLLPLLSLLRPVGSEWVDFKFPTALDHWLKKSWILEPPSVFKKEDRGPSCLKRFAEAVVPHEVEEVSTFEASDICQQWESHREDKIGDIVDSALTPDSIEVHHTQKRRGYYTCDTDNMEMDMDDMEDMISLELIDDCEATDQNELTQNLQLEKERNAEDAAFNATVGVNTPPMSQQSKNDLVSGDWCTEMEEEIGEPVARTNAWSGPRGSRKKRSQQNAPGKNAPTITLPEKTLPRKERSRKKRSQNKRSRKKRSLGKNAPGTKAP